MPDYIFVKDVQSRLIFTNVSHLQTLGAENLEQVIGKTDFDFFSRHLAEQYIADEQIIIREDESLIHRMVPVRKDSSLSYLSM